MKKNIFSTLAVATTLLLPSCMDFEPEAELSDAQVWTSASNFQLFANQFYGYLRDIASGSSYQYAVSDGVHSDLRSDLCCQQNLNAYSAGTNSIPESDGNYTSLYKRIYYTNLLLDRAKSYSNQNEIVTPIAEAKFFRAYLYFELVQIYGDAILVTTPLDLDADELKATRNNRSEIIDLCVADLTEAADMLPETPSEIGRLCKDAALAMLSRVGLYEGTWQKFHNNNTSRATQLLTIAKESAAKVIAGGRYKLFYSDVLGTESYRYMFILEDTKCNLAGLTTADNTEYILARRHRIEDKLGLNITKAYLGNAIYPTRKLANMYRCQDGLPIDKSPIFQGYTGVLTEYQSRDNRMLTTLLPHGTKCWNNTANNCREAWDETDEARALTSGVTANSGYQTHKWAVERYVADYYESMDYPVIRYAEVLLNYAEATYEIDEQISDADLDLSLNIVRLRINPNMTKLSNALVSANNLSMREEIRAERTVELVFEGYRIDDLKRWKTAETEMPQDQLGILYTGTWFETNWTSQSRSLNSDGCIIMYDGRVWNQKHYLYPLPSDQLQLNPNLQQNPGWE